MDDWILDDLEPLKAMWEIGSWIIGSWVIWSPMIGAVLGPVGVATGNLGPTWDILFGYLGHLGAIWRQHRAIVVPIGIILETREAREAKHL